MVDCQRGMMVVQVMVNGEMREVADSLTVAELVDELGFSGRRIAVEINLEIVPRSSHQQHRIQGGDRIEIVQAIGGG